jgi:hypothetical protein
MRPTDEADRAAILARRQRFVALALSGLAATTTSCERASARPCLDIATPEDVQNAREREERERAEREQAPVDPNATPDAEPAPESPPETTPP